MRKLALLAALLAVPLAPVHGVTLVDRIVAVVNKEVITYSELNEAVGMAERQLRRQGTPAPERPVLERQMLERLILDKAQPQPEVPAVGLRERAVVQAHPHVSGPRPA